LPEAINVAWSKNDDEARNAFWRLPSRFRLVITSAEGTEYEVGEVRLDWREGLREALFSTHSKEDIRGIFEKRGADAKGATLFSRIFLARHVTSIILKTTAVRC